MTETSVLFVSNAVYIISDIIRDRLADSFRGRRSILAQALVRLFTAREGMRLWLTNSRAAKCSILLVVGLLTGCFTRILALQFDRAR
jgi:hypothetical protein